MIHNPPILQAVPAFGLHDNLLGRPAARYAIRNLVNDHVWTGNGFSPDWERALLYAHPNEACIDMREILLKVYQNEPLAVFEAPCRVEVFGEATMEQVQRWLSHSAVLKLRTDDYGNGPRNSLVIPSIHWAEMEQIDAE